VGKVVAVLVAVQNTIRHMTRTAYFRQVQREFRRTLGYIGMFKVKSKDFIPLSNLKDCYHKTKAMYNMRVVNREKSSGGSDFQVYILINKFVIN